MQTCLAQHKCVPGALVKNIFIQWNRLKGEEMAAVGTTTKAILGTKILLQGHLIPKYTLQSRAGSGLVYCIDPCKHDRPAVHVQ